MKALMPLLVVLLLIGACGPSLPASAPHDLLQQTPEPADRPLLNGTLTTIPAPGKVTIVDFWATFCEPCLTEMPELERYWRSADQTRVQVIGISLDDDSYVVGQKLDELGITFPQVIDDGHVLKGRYLVDSIPAAFVLDQHGRIRYYASAASYGAAQVIEAAEALLAE